MQHFPTDRIGANRLAQFFDLSEEVVWSERDGADALRHQLAAPLLPDLLVTRAVDTRELEAFLSKFKGPACFGLHLNSRTPSLTLLTAMKHFAKQVGENPSNPLSGSAGTVLYYASIAAALVRCNARISSLDNDHLRKGFEWARGQPGAESLTELFEIALTILSLT